MSATKKLLHNTLIYSIGSLGSKVMSFALVPLFSFFLTKSELGHYDLILTTLSLFVPIVTLQISEASYRWLLDSKGDFSAQRVAISNGFFILILSIIISLILYIVLKPFLKFDHSNYFLGILVLAALLPFGQQILRGLGDNKSFSFSGIINTASLFLFSVSFLYYSGWGLSGLLSATLFAYALTILFIVKRSALFRYLSITSISKKALGEMLNYAWPLIPNAVSWWMISASNRYIILASLGADYNGVFALANRFPSIILIVNSIFMLAWQDHVIGEDDNKSHDINTSIFDKFMRLEFGLVIFLISISKYIVKFLVDPKFFEAWKYMPLLYSGVLFSSFCAFLGSAYIKQKKTTRIFYTTILGGVINIVVSYLLIPSLGLFGPALGTLTGFLVVWLVRMYETRTFFPLTVNFTVFFQLISLTSLYTYLILLDYPWLDYILIIFSLAIGFLFNQEIFKNILNILTRRFQKFSDKDIVLSNNTNTK